MKFSATTAVALLATLSNALVERDLKLIQDILAENLADIATLDKAANDFNGDKGPLVAAANTFVGHLKTRLPQVQASSVLSLEDTLAVANTVLDLSNAGTKLVADFKARKADVEKYSECATVKSQLGDVNVNAKALINGIIDKVSPDAKDAAVSLTKPLLAALDQAVVDYSDCKDATPPASSTSQPPVSSTSSSTPGSSAPGSSAPGSSAPGSSAPGSSTAPGSTSKPTGSTDCVSSTPTKSVPSGTDCITTVKVTSTSTAPCPACPPPTGGVTSNSPPAASTTGLPPVVTAGAALFAPAGTFALAVAALLAL